MKNSSNFFVSDCSQKPKISDMLFWYEKSTDACLELRSCIFGIWTPVRFDLCVQKSPPSSNPQGLASSRRGPFGGRAAVIPLGEGNPPPAACSGAGRARSTAGVSSNFKSSNILFIIPLHISANHM